MLKLMLLVVLLAVITPSETFRGLASIGRLFSKLFRSGIRTAAQFARKVAPAFRKIGAIRIARGYSKSSILDKLEAISMFDEYIGPQKLESSVNDADANSDGVIDDTEWDSLWRNIESELESAVVQKRSANRCPDATNGQCPVVDNE